MGPPGLRPGPAPPPGQGLRLVNREPGAEARLLLDRELAALGGDPGEVLSSRWLLDQLASLPGYDPARCGELIATRPPPRPPLSPSLEPVP